MVKRYFQNILYLLPVCAGIAALAAVLSGHSDEKNAMFFGFSKLRFLLIIAALGFLLFAILAFFFRKKKQTYLYYFCCFFGIPSAEILLFSRFPSDDTRNLIPLIAERGMPLFLAALLGLKGVLGMKSNKRYWVFGAVVAFSAVCLLWGRQLLQLVFSLLQRTGISSRSIEMFISGEIGSDNAHFVAQLSVRTCN